VCLECHDNKTRGFLTDFVSAKIEELKKRFGK
jgi:ferritin